MKLPAACFGETLFWRKKRETSDLGKHDVEYNEGTFLGMSGTLAEIVLGTPKGIVRARDVRVITESAIRWNADFVLRCTMSFEQYIDPSEQLPERIVNAPSAVVHDGLPEMPEVFCEVTEDEIGATGPQHPQVHRWVSQMCASTTRGRRAHLKPHSRV